MPYALACTTDRVSSAVPSSLSLHTAIGCRLHTSIILCRVVLNRAKGVVFAKVIAVYQGVMRLLIPVERCFCFQPLFRALLLLQFWV